MTEEPGMLQSMGSQRVRHDLVTKQQSFVTELILTIDSALPLLEINPKEIIMNVQNDLVIRIFLRVNF